MLKKLGLKDFIIWKILCLIEYTINLPYILIKFIIDFIYSIFDLLSDLVDKRFIFKLSKINFIYKYISKLKDKVRNWGGYDER